MFRLIIQGNTNEEYEDKSCVRNEGNLKGSGDRKESNGHEGHEGDYNTINEGRRSNDEVDEGNTKASDERSQHKQQDQV